MVTVVHSNLEATEAKMSARDVSVYYGDKMAIDSVSIDIPTEFVVGLMDGTVFGMEDPRMRRMQRLDLVAHVARQRPRSQHDVAAYVSKYVAKGGEVDFSKNFGAWQPPRPEYRVTVPAQNVLPGTSRNPAPAD